MMGLTAVVICTTGKLRLILLVVELAIAVAVGIFVVETIEHPASPSANETDQTHNDSLPAEQPEKRGEAGSKEKTE